MTSIRGWQRRDPTGLREVELGVAEPGDGRVRVSVEGVALDELATTPVGQIPGAAAVGVVVGVGRAAGEWLGARVLVPQCEPCGECEQCRRGGTSACPTGLIRGVTGAGTLVTHLTAATRWLVRLEGPLELTGFAVAALGGELGRAYALYARLGVGAREPTIVWGTDALARACAAILAAKGAPAVFAHGDTSVAELDDQLASHGHRPRKVIVTRPELVARALAAAGSRATVVVAATPTLPPRPTIDGTTAEELHRALARECTVAGVGACHPDLVPELVALAARRELDLDALVRVVPRPALADALDRAPLASTVVSMT